MCPNQPQSTKLSTQIQVPQNVLWNLTIDPWKERNSKCQHVTPPSSPLKAYSVCVSLLVVHIASLWNQNLNQDVFQTLGSSSVDKPPPELRERAQKSNRKGIENRDCIEKNLLARNLVGSLLPLFPAPSDSSRLLVQICTSAQAQNLCKDSKSNFHPSLDGMVSLEQH